MDLVLATADDLTRAVDGTLGETVTTNTVSYTHLTLPTN